MTARRLRNSTTTGQAKADVICHALKHLGIGHTRESRGDRPIVISVYREEAGRDVSIAILADGRVRGVVS